MTERKTLSDMPARGALADGADKFDRIARGLNAPKPSEHSAPQPGVPQMTGVSPDEVWAKSYMTYGIGGREEPPVVAGFAPISHLVTMPKFVMPDEPIVPKTTEIVARPEPAAEIIPSGPIGMHIGKPMRKRSWLGRVFLGTR